jgi:DNA-binding NtrC family response regulator
VHHGYVIVDAADGVIRPPDRFDAPIGSTPPGLRVGRSIREVEKELIQMTLEHCKGDKSSAAAMLGVCLKTLYNRLNEYAAEAQSQS